MLWLFARFCGVGVAATALQYLILTMLIEAAQVDAVAASAIGFVANATATYSWITT
jgi:putative flippase GtrA